MIPITNIFMSVFADNISQNNYSVKPQKNGHASGEVCPFGLFNYSPFFLMISLRIT